jgi:hypothetical protein
MEFFINNHPVRFTPNGKIFILDAISAVVETNTAASIWEMLKTEKPEIHQYVENFGGAERSDAPTCDSKGWDIIREALFEYLVSVLD